MNEYKICLDARNDVRMFCVKLHELLDCEVEYSYETLYETATGKKVYDVVVFYVRTGVSEIVFGALMALLFGLRPIKGYYM